MKLATLRRTLTADLGAGLTTALVTIPDGMASAILAGVSPIHGLYALMVGTPVAALTTSSQFMYVSNTGALAVAVGSALAGLSGEEKIQALVVLTILVGAFQLLLGVLKLGGMIRFVSQAVMTGFMSGIAMLIILGQLGDFTGFDSTYSNKVLKAIDLLGHLNEIHFPTLAVGLVTIALIVLMGWTRFEKFSMIVAILVTTLLVPLVGWKVALVRDIADIPSALPIPTWPALRLIPGLLSAAVAIGIIGLVQGAGVSKTVPNPDGTYADVSRDFAGQGLANLASGFFKGLPIGGTMSETAVNVSAGAKSRWANVYSGVFIIGLILIFTNVIARFAMPAIAALLIVAGFQAIKFEDIADVWDVGLGPRVVMLLTFGLTLALPVQVAVFWGVVASALIYWYRSSADIRLTEIVPEADGSYTERPVPESLDDESITVINIYGSVFYAAAQTLEGLLPSLQGAQRAVVILRLRGRGGIGSTLIRVLERYAHQLQRGGGKLILVGVSAHVKEQLDKTETQETIAEEDIFLASDRLGESTQAALAAARAWLRPETRATDG